MPPTLRLALILAVSPALAACEGNEEKATDQRTAGGEILPGSISDSMLPYDTVRSQPPLAREPEGPGRAASGPQPTGADGDTADTPAETPAEAVEASATGTPVAE